MIKRKENRIKHETLRQSREQKNLKRKRRLKKGHRIYDKENELHRHLKNERYYKKPKIK